MYQYNFLCIFVLIVDFNHFLIFIFVLLLLRRRFFLFDFHFIPLPFVVLILHRHRHLQDFNFLILLFLFFLLTISSQYLNLLRVGFGTFATPYFFRNQDSKIPPIPIYKSYLGKVPETFSFTIRYFWPTAATIDFKIS